MAAAALPTATEVPGPGNGVLTVAQLIKCKHCLSELRDAGELDRRHAALLYASALLELVYNEDMPMEHTFSKPSRNRWLAQTWVKVDPIVLDVISGSSESEVMLAYISSERQCSLRDFTTS